MNISDKIKQFNQTEIKLLEEQQTRVNSFKEEVFEDFLSELKISKREFTSMNHHKALEFLKANFDKIELRSFYNQKIIALETILFYYFPNNTFSHYYVPNIFDLEDYESERETLDEFISNFKKI